MKYTTVRSDLARQERYDDESARCESRLTLRQTFAKGFEKGSTLQCTRPASRHRVHEHGFIQWEKGDR